MLLKTTFPQSHVLIEARLIHHQARIEQKSHKLAVLRILSVKAEQSEAEPDSSTHSADDYEEMDAARKRDSFLEGGPDDVYQNTWPTG